MSSKIIGFIGAGKMGASLAMGIVKAGVVRHEDIVVYDTYAPAVEEMGKKGCKMATSNSQVIADSDVIFLAIKPQMLEAIKCDFNGFNMSEKLLVSILPGVSTQFLETLSSAPGARVIRVMPNTPCLVGKSASAFCMGKYATQQDADFINDALSAVGICFQVREDKMEAVTGVCGSGPAYIYMVIEAMADAGIKLGLTADISTKLAAQTVVGAGQMVLETKTHPAQLRNEVCSPGGATICAVSELEKNGLRYAMMQAVESAAAKAQDLGKHGA